MMKAKEILESPSVPCPDPNCTHGDLYFGRTLCSYDRLALLSIIQKTNRRILVTREQLEQELAFLDETFKS